MVTGDGDIDGVLDSYVCSDKDNGRSLLPPFVLTDRIQPTSLFSDKKFDRMVEYYTRPLSVPFLFHASGGSSWPSSQINIKMYSSKSEVILWSDKDNGVPPLHALIEPLYPLMATLAPCPKHCLCSQHTRDHENITKAHENRTKHKRKR